MSLQLTAPELSQMPNTISITRQVGKTHPNLGARTAFMKTIDCANMACMQVGISGIGKTKSLIAVQNMRHRQVFTKKFTLAGVKQKFNDFFSNSETSWINFEMTDMSDITAENMFKVVCDLITDYNCEIDTKYYHMDIHNARISYLVACNYEIFNKLWKIPAFRGNFRDRILRFFTFSPRLKTINPDDPRAVITMNFPDVDDIRVDTSAAWFWDVLHLFEGQFTYARSYEYALRILKGSAALNHREEASIADAKFILLFAGNVKAEKWASSRETLSGPIELDIDALMLFSEAVKSFGVSINEILERQTVRKGGINKLVDSIYNHPNLLVKSGDWVFPSPKLMEESILPQVKFERMCMEIGDAFY